MQIRYPKYDPSCNTKKLRADSHAPSTTSTGHFTSYSYLCIYALIPHQNTALSAPGLAVLASFLEVEQEQLYRFLGFSKTETC